MVCIYSGQLWCEVCATHLGMDGLSMGLCLVLGRPCYVFSTEHKVHFLSFMKEEVVSSVDIYPHYTHVISQWWDKSLHVVWLVLIEMSIFGVYLVMRVLLFSLRCLLSSFPPTRTPACNAIIKHVTCMWSTIMRGEYINIVSSAGRQYSARSHAFHNNMVIQAHCHDRPFLNL